VSERTPRVLAVDDDESFLKVVELMLTEAGMQVMTAPRGDLGLERYLAERPDIVLLDRMMPGLDGQTLCRRIKEAAGQTYVPVLFFTAMDQVPDTVAGLDAGADDYISKQVAKSELLARVRAHLRLCDVYRELWESREKLVELDRFRSRFLSTVSHELRTPLHGIRSYAALLGEGVYGPLTADQRRAASGIDECAAALSRMVESLLELARLEARMDSIKPEPVVVGSAIARALAMVMPIAEAKGLALRVSGPDDAALETDASLLHQILVNLLGNAVKYTEKGDVTVEFSSAPPYVDVVVRDTGDGIDEALLAHLAAGTRPPAPAGDSSGTARGMGLGFAIVRHCLELLGGRVELRSRVGQGTTVRVRLCSLGAAPPGDPPPPA
jgi:signal transduction histidine kinase